AEQPGPLVDKMPVSNASEFSSADQPEVMRPSVPGAIASGQAPSPAISNKVFVTHGRNRELVPQLKELLTFGQFEPVVSVERESVSKPVPDKVLDDMRSCG